MFETLTTLFRARAAEAEEGLIDRNAITLLAQHLRDARAEIARSRAAVARLMAREAERGRALDALASAILAREAEAAAAMDKGDEELAADIAEAILALEDRKAADEAARAKLATQIADSRTRLEASERRLVGLTDQLRAAREAGLARHVVGATIPTASALDRAVETARTLKERDQRLADLEDAHRRLETETEAETLDARIREAGLDKTHEARRKALLNRIAAKADGKPKSSKQGETK